VKIKCKAAFPAKMAQQYIHGQTEDSKAQTHLLHDWCHVCPEHHLRHLVTVTDVKDPKQKLCHPDMSIYILFFPALNISILLHMPRIASVLKILFQIR